MLKQFIFSAIFFYLVKSQTCSPTCTQSQLCYESICLDCYSNCLTCEGSSTNCTSCPISMYLFENFCYQSCPQRTYYNSTQLMCLNCEQDCLICTDNQTCTTCLSNYILYNNSCWSNCPFGTFYDGLTCSNCTNNCSSCYNETVCYTCISNNFINIQQTCISQCVSGYYIYQNPYQNQCLPCSSGCLTCKGGNNNDCLSCSKKQGYLSQSQCLSKCPIGYYPNTQLQTCNACHQFCTSCTGALPSQCQSCKLGFYFAASITSCFISCPVPYFGQNSLCVLQCQAYTWAHPLTRNCLGECPDPYWGDIKSSQCLQVCPLGTYEDLANKECKMCGKECAKCTGQEQNQCLQCSVNYYMNQGVCGQCPSDLYSNNITRSCKAYLTYTAQIIKLDNINDYVTLKISFSSEVMSQTLNFQNQVTVEGMELNVSYTVNQNEIIQNIEYLVIVQFLVSHNNTQIVLNFTDLLDIFYTPLLNQNPQYIDLTAQFIESNSENTLINLGRIMTNVYLCIYMVVFVIFKILRQQIPLFYMIIYELQQINLLLLLNMNFSGPIQKSLAYLDSVNLRTIPTVGLSIENSGASIKYFSHPLVQQISSNNVYLIANYYDSFLVNGGIQYFLYIIAFWVLWTIIFALQNLFELKKKQKQAVIFKGIFTMTNELLIRIHEILYLPIAVFFLLQVWNPNFDDGFNIASFVTSIIIMLYLLNNFKNSYNSINAVSDKEEYVKDIEKRYGELFLDFGQNNRIKKNFLFVQLIFKTLFVLMLVLLNDFMWVQFSMCLSLQVLYLGILAWQRPYKLMFVNITAFLGQLLFITLLIIILSGQIKFDSISSQDVITVQMVKSYYVIGTVFVVFIQLLLSLFAFLLLVRIFYEFQEYVSKNPRWCQDFIDQVKSLCSENEKKDQSKMSLDTESIEMRDFKI